MNQRLINLYNYLTHQPLLNNISVTQTTTILQLTMAGLQQQRLCLIFPEQHLLKSELKQ